MPSMTMRAYALAAGLVLCASVPAGSIAAPREKPPKPAPLQSTPIQPLTATPLKCEAGHPVEFWNATITNIGSSTIRKGAHLKILYIGAYSNEGEHWSEVLTLDAEFPPGGKIHGSVYSGSASCTVTRVD